MASRALLVSRARASTLQTTTTRRSSSSIQSLIPNRCFNLSSPALLNDSVFRQPRSNLSLLATTVQDDDEYTVSPALHSHQQWRWKRKGGASAFSKPRPPSKKKLKRYHRRKKQQWHETVGRHSAPGSKASQRRLYYENEWNDLLQHDPNAKEKEEEEQLEYSVSNALVEDLMGNTAYLSSTPTPQPVYLGHRHKQFYNQVAEQVQQYRQAQQLALTQESSGAETSTTELSTKVSKLPSDKDISLVLRAYRDRHGTKSKPIGIHKALQHLLQDLSLPLDSFGEFTYTTLLTCCRTPKEARRVMKLQQDQQHDVSSYSWSILVDVHAKMGDYKGCVQVMEEAASRGVAPTLAAYTSLLAACYKVCNDGRIPHSIRAEAGKVGWSKWKELRIVGLDPDVMAYGAMLRLCAARGQPERALSLLEEMQTFSVKPTTLCFTSALKAVARSHQTAIRYERAFSKKNRRREMVTAHHGKLARSIVILAENAQVNQDEGFVAALMLCAAAAGDSATAKAVLLASHVRRMDHLRTIGSNQHLNRLSGGGNNDLLLTDGGDKNKLEAAGGSKHQQQKHVSSFPSFQDREYGGKDTRTLSALLLACSQAAENRGLGDIWAGRENKGYLCDNSLRLITVRPTPKYVSEKVPGMSYQEVAQSAMVWDEDEEPETMGKRLRRKKFRGVDIDPDAGLTLEEMDPEIQNMFAEDQYEEETVDAQELIMGKENHKVEQHHIDMIEGGTSTAYFDAATGTFHYSDGIKEAEAFETDSDGDVEEEVAAAEEPKEEWYFDMDARKWKTRTREESAARTVTVDPPVSTSSESVKTKQHKEEQVEEEEMYFDYKLMQWKTRPKGSAADAESDTGAPQTAELDTDSHNVEHEFQLFFEGLKEEVRASGENIEVTESDAREFFDQARKEESLDELESLSIDGGDADMEIDPDEFQMFYDGLKNQIKESGENLTISEKDARELFVMTKNEFNAENQQAILENDSPAARTEFSAANKSPDTSTDSEFEIFYERLKQEALDVGADPDVDVKEARELFDMIKSGDVGDTDEEPFLDGNEDLVPAGSMTFGASDEITHQKSFSDESSDCEFQSFYESLKKEAMDRGADRTVSEQYARELYGMFKTDYTGEDEKPVDFMTEPSAIDKKTATNFEEMFKEIKDEWGLEDIDLDEAELQAKSQEATDIATFDEPELQENASFRESLLKTKAEFDDHLGPRSRSVQQSFNPEITPLAQALPSDQAQEKEVFVAEEMSHSLADAKVEGAMSPSVIDIDTIQESDQTPATTADTSVSRHDRFAEMDKELSEVLPGMPASRIKKIRNVFVKTLGDPSMLRLVPLLRENMPDYVTPGWLKKKNLQNAAFCMKMARQNGLLDVHMMNGMLQVETSCGSLDRALQFHDEQFKRHKVKPTPYSDRLVLQMLVKSNRLERALKFKDRVEDAGRQLDIQSYGSIMDHYGRKKQLGSALLVLKECIQVHGAPPSEKYLSKIRLLCRQQEMEDEVGIFDLIGEDPVEWIRHGEANLKREMSYRGRRNIQYAKNRLVHI